MKHADSMPHSSGRSGGDSLVLENPAAGVLQKIPTPTDCIGFILIEHDLEIALRVVERVTVLHNGRLLKEGTPDEIEGDAEVQAIYMGGSH